jgi:hypothetical protein
MESNLNEFDEEERTKPTLLKVLCILTFIGSSWLILYQIWSYSNASVTAQMFSTVKNVGQKDSVNQDSSVQQQRARHKGGFFLGKKMMISVSKMMTVENIRKTAIGTIMSAILTLIGAILMWWLKRSGFYLYITGTIIGLSVPFYLYGANTMSVGISFFSGFFGLIFIALYALNIKSLR